jgi:hypothetical protein
VRCIFCRLDSSASRSIEHIVPESLGNQSHVLPKGVVCDRCNNYFAREVEKPFMDAPAIELLRFHQALESKKGRVPPVSGVIWPNIPVSVTRDLKLGTSVDIPIGVYHQVANATQGTLILPNSLPLPTGSVVSRFLAKVGLEAMAARLCNYPEGLDYLCDEPQLDAVRDHARRGKFPSWPIYTRRIYDADGKTFGPQGLAEQVVHESDFLVTPANEWYFVLALFGQEFTINMGGPDVEGYLLWLAENHHESPLYAGKNSSGYPKPIPEKSRE